MNEYSALTGVSTSEDLYEYLKDCFFIIDENVFKFHRKRTLKNLSSEKVFIFPSGEIFKNIKTIERIWDFLLSNYADRKSRVAIIGGGVVCDAGGFACATYKRGISYCLVPTTLLSMTDAAIGGKTGINLSKIKNIVGTFTNPISTLIYVPFLETLSERELQSGKAEMLKHAFLTDEFSTHFFLENHRTITSEAILKSAEFKWKVVLSDPEEYNIRKCLNFGHTIGHIIEGFFSETRRPFTHGESIAIGMAAETDLAFNMGLCTSEFKEAVREAVLSLGFRLEIPEADPEELKSMLLQDKKNESGIVKLSFLREYGDPVWDVPVSAEAVIDLLKKRYYK